MCTQMHRLNAPCVRKRIYRGRPSFSRGRGGILTDSVKYKHRKALDRSKSNLELLLVNEIWCIIPKTKDYNKFNYEVILRVYPGNRPDFEIRTVQVINVLS